MTGISGELICNPCYNSASHWVDGVPQSIQLGLFLLQKNAFVRRLEDHWLRFAPMGRARNGYYTVTGNWPPRSTIFPAHVTTFKEAWVYHRHLRENSMPVEYQNIQYCINGADNSQILNRNTTFPEDNCMALAEGIHHGVAVTISGGAFKEGKGSAAWVIEGMNSHCQCLGTTMVPGGVYNQSAHRCELWGILAMVSMIHNICSYHKITTGSVYWDAIMNPISLYPLTWTPTFPLTCQKMIYFGPSIIN
jgi:hypothetical protein